MTTLTCDQARDLLPDREDLATQDRDLASALAGHLEDCAACRAESELLAVLRRATPAVPVPLEARVLRATRQRAVVRVWGSGRQLAVAATLVGAVIGGSLLLRVVDEGRSGTHGGPADEAAVGAASLLPALDDPVLHGGSLLPNLTEAELESLLARMES